MAQWAKGLSAENLNLIPRFHRMEVISQIWKRGTWQGWRGEGCEAGTGPGRAHGGRFRSMVSARPHVACQAEESAVPKNRTEQSGGGQGTNASNHSDLRNSYLLSQELGEFQEELRVQTQLVALISCAASSGCMKRLMGRNGRWLSG